ncbi:MAG: Na+/proline symporter, partial [Gemmataceae bacterium]
MMAASPLAISGPDLVPWLVLGVYALAILAVTPRRVRAVSFFDGHAESGAPPGLWVLVASTTISWIMAKSIDNAASLAAAFGLAGGVGYAIYYLGFITAGVAIYLIRVRGGHTSLPGFLADKYGPTCAKLFLVAVFIRLYNEVWSNTKVYAQFFGREGSSSYWLAVAAVTLFTVYYSWGGGLRSSLLTDVLQMLLAGVLLGAILWALSPGIVEHGLPVADEQQQRAGLTFCGLALVQLFSYPFHDPVLTDRAFITPPRTMLWGFILSAFLGGLFILLFSSVGLFALGHGIKGNPSVSVPLALGGPLLLVV